MTITDQLHRTLTIPQTPFRIVSLVPSQTELLYHLGLTDSVCGITKFCVHPHHWLREKTVVGGTKNLHLEKIAALKPDLVIANREENTREQIDELAEHYPVWISDVTDLETALQMIEQIGIITDTVSKTKLLTEEIRKGFDHLKKLTAEFPPKRTAYFIWRDPYMTVGGDTFIHDLLSRCGLKNIFEEEERYPQLDLQMLSEKKCEVLLLASEPFPFTEKHIEEIQTLLPEIKILLADGEMFSWYGSRLALAPAYFQQLLNSIHQK